MIHRYERIISIAALVLLAISIVLIPAFVSRADPSANKLVIEHGEQASYYHLDNNIVYTCGRFMPELLPESRSASLLSGAMNPSLAMPYQAGWPIVIGTGIGGSCGYGGTFADLDLDGDLELIQGAGDSYIYAWHHDGIPVTGWPFPTGSHIMATPAVGDINNDGYPEVVCNSNDGYIYAITHDGNLMDGWPIQTDSRFDDPDYRRLESSPVIADVNGDAFFDVIFNVMWYNRAGTYVWDYRGEDLPGWPQLFTDHEWTDCTPCVADLDGDGSVEIISGVIFTESSYYNIIHIWHADGTPMYGWPIKFEDYYWSPFRSVNVGDVNGDGALDIVAADMQYVYAVEQSGDLITGWPYYIGFDFWGHYTALLNADADAGLEVVVTWPSGHQLILLDNDGTVMPGFPVTVAKVNHATAADIDNDDRIEIVCDSYESNSIQAFNDDGSPVTGFPFPTLGNTYYYPNIVDVDGDGDIEICAGEVSQIPMPLCVYIWDCEWPADNTAEGWTTFMHDRFNTGMYGFKVPTPSINMPPVEFALLQNYPNPFNPTTTISFDLHCAVHVKLCVFNVKGELVATIANRPMTEGRKEISWNAKDHSGREIASGLYFYNLVAGDFVQTKKMILLK